MASHSKSKSCSGLDLGDLLQDNDTEANGKSNNSNSKTGLLQKKSSNSNSNNAVDRLPTRKSFTQANPNANATATATNRLMTTRASFTQANPNNANNSATASSSNAFPTRASIHGLQMIDQRVNLMDVEAAAYDDPSDSTYDNSFTNENEDAGFYTAAAASGSGSGSSGGVRGATAGGKFRPPRKGSMTLIRSGLSALRQKQQQHRRSLPDIYHDDHNNNSSSDDDSDDDEDHEVKRKSHSMSFLMRMGDDNTKDKDSNSGKDNSDSSGNSGSRNSNSNSNSNSSSSGEFHKSAFEFEQGLMRVRAKRNAELWWKRMKVLVGLSLIAMAVIAVVAANRDDKTTSNDVAGTGTASTSRTAGTITVPELVAIGRQGSDASAATARGATVKGMVAPPLPPTTTPVDIQRRTFDLRYVVDKVILSGQPNHHHLMDTNARSTQKAVEWMTGHDVVSMKLLDHYRNSHHQSHSYTHHLRGRRRRRTLQQQQQQQQTEHSFAAFGPHVSHHYEMDHDDIQQTSQIMNRYIPAVAYFEKNPTVSAKTVVHN